MKRFALAVVVLLAFLTPGLAQDQTQEPQQADRSATGGAQTLEDIMDGATCDKIRR